MKKILLVNTRYKDFGGEDTNFFEEINFLSKNYNVDYLEFDNSDRLNFNDLLSFIFNTNLKSKKIFKNKIENFKPDVVYIHNTWFKASLGIFSILKKNNITTLVKIHNFRYKCANSYFVRSHLQDKNFCNACNKEKKKYVLFNKYYEDSFGKSILLIRYIRKYLKLLKLSNFKILAITDYHKTELSNLINPKQIFVFNNPIEFNQNIKRNANNEDYVVYAGRLTQSKGLLELLYTWNKSFHSSSIKLKIIGTGDLETYLKNNYQGSNIEFLGFKDNVTTLNMIANSLAVVTATKMLEGQPRLLCEASSLGVPSIFPKFGGMSEFFPNNYELAFRQFDYEELSTKIKLLNDKKLMNNLGSECLIFIEKKLNNQKMLIKFQEIINT